MIYYLNETSEQELLEAKARLYHALLCMNPDKMTESDVNFMLELSKDPSIQEILATKMKGN